MASAEFLNVADFFKQTVHEMSDIKLFELSTPGYSALKRATETKDFTEKGYRIPLWTQKPGGHTFFTPAASDFNAAKSPQSQSMYVFPTGYAFPIHLQGPLVRALRKGGKDAIISARQYIKLHTDVAMKRINQMSYGDGSGALAFSSSTLGATGSGQTLNCTTAAAATPGQTKGAKRLEINQLYDAINTATGAVRGQLTVETEGSSSCVVNVTSGTVSSGDPIVDRGAYNKVMRGLGHLISDQNRTLQLLATASFTDLNAPVNDLNGSLLTPAVLETVKSQLNTRNNDEAAENGLLGFITLGQLSNLRKQGYGFRQYSGDDNTIRGISKKYVDGDTVWVPDADCDEDRVYLVKPEDVKLFEEMPFGDYDLDGQDMRMLMGTNNTGSDAYSKAVGCRSNAGILRGRSSAFIKRAQISGVTTQVGS
jgi:hypothetical protein